MWLAALLSPLVVHAGEPAAPPDALALASARRAEVAAALDVVRSLHAEAVEARDASTAACLARKLPSLDALDRLAEGALFVVGVGESEAASRAELGKLAVARERAEELLEASRACTNELVGAGELAVPLEPSVPLDPEWVVPVIVEPPPAMCGTCR